ncbi:MAG: hypothetical protein V1716_00640 [Candidatus Uhrbacteria bacterium]
MSTAEQVRNRIKGLERGLSEAKGLRRQLEMAQNELALLTARAFIVIDDGKGVFVLGASQEVASKAARLTVTMKDCSIIEVKCCLDSGSVTVRLVVAGRVSFTVTDYDSEGEGKNYLVLAFSDKLSAETWAAGRRRENSSR